MAGLLADPLLLVMVGVFIVTLIVLAVYFLRWRKPSPEKVEEEISEEIVKVGMRQPNIYWTYLKWICIPLAIIMPWFFIAINWWNMVYAGLMTALEAWTYMIISGMSAFVAFVVGWWWRWSVQSKKDWINLIYNIDENKQWSGQFALSPTEPVMDLDIRSLVMLRKAYKSGQFAEVKK